MSFPEQFEKAINKMDLSKQQSAPKTFEVNHIETNDGGSDYYYKGTIEAVDLDAAIEIFKNEWVEDEHKNEMMVYESDSDTEVFELYTDFFEDGDKLTEERENELIKKYNVEDITDLIDNNDVTEDIGYLTHLYEIKEVDSEEDEESD